MSLTPILLLTLVLSSCSLSPSKIHKVVSEETQLGPEGLTITSEKALEAPNYVNILCLELPEGYELSTDDWRIKAPGGKSIDFGGELILTVGRVLALSQKSGLNLTPCLSPETDQLERERQRPDFAISKVRVWTSEPLRVKQIIWHSTDK